MYTCGRYPNSFALEALTLKYKLDNEFELVYVVGILTHSPMKLLHSKYKLDNEIELVYTCGRCPNSFALEALTLKYKLDNEFELVYVVRILTHSPMKLLH